MPGLWKPLDHEKSARKDKALNPDYREGFAEKVEQKFPKPDLSFKITRNGLTIIKSRESIAQRLKDNAKRTFRTQVNREPFWIQGYKYWFKAKLTDFCAANNLMPEKGKTLFLLVQKEAKERREMIERRIRNSKLRESSDDVSGSTFLHLDSVWNDVFRFVETENVSSDSSNSGK